MNIQYTYERGTFFETLAVKTTQGAMVEINFDNGDVSHVSINGIEIPAMDDAVQSIFLSLPKGRLEDEIISLSSLIRHAEGEVESYRNEAEEEERDEANHVAELSSPYLTGRI